MMANTLLADSIFHLPTTTKEDAHSLIASERESRGKDLPQRHLIHLLSCGSLRAFRALVGPYFKLKNAKTQR
jgi:hypothetical protein